MRTVLYFKVCHMLNAFFSYFCSCCPLGDVKTISLPPAPKDFSIKDASVEKGSVIFKAQCFLCHGATGKGNGIGAPSGTPIPDFTNKDEMTKRSDWRLFSIIKEGGQKFGHSPLMASYASTLSDTQIKDLVAFIRSLSSQKKQKDASTPTK